MWKFGFTALAMLWLFGANAQCLLQHIPLNQRMENASVVIEGVVEAQVAFEDADNNHIYTANTIKITRVVKGRMGFDETVVFTQGGQVGDRMETVYPSLQLRMGSTGLFMLDKVHTLEVDKASPHQRHLGVVNGQVAGYFGVSGPSSFIEYDMISRRAIDVFETFPSVAALISDLEQMTGAKSTVVSEIQFPIRAANKTGGITSFSPTTITAGNQKVLTISGSGFGSDYGSVGFANADKGGSSTNIYSDSIYIVSWSDTEVKVYVPQAAGTGKVQVITAANNTYTSTADLTVSYARLELISSIPKFKFKKKLYSPNLEDDNAKGGYTWQLNVDMKAKHPAVKALMRAMQNWRCSTNVNFEIDTTHATTIHKVARDGVHCFMWQNADQSITSGALAVTYSQWSGCYNSSSQDWHWFLNDVDMVFDDELATGKTWNFGPGSPKSDNYDFESVALHELGHAHQLGHIIDDKGVMHYSIKNGEQKRVLNNSVDVAGGNDVMASSSKTTGCSSVFPMVAISNNCKIIDVVIVKAGFEISSFYVCRGDTVYLSDTSKPAKSHLTWRIPAEGKLLNGGSVHDASIAVKMAGKGKVDFGLFVENQGFVDSFYVEFKSNPNPENEMKLTNLTCYESKNGEASISMPVGKGPFSVTWLDDNSNTNPRKKMEAGSYSFVCVDDNGCMSDTTFELTQPDSLYFTKSGTTATWGGLDRGTAFVEANGGTAPYSYLWSDPKKQTTATAEKLAAGSYSVSVTDKNDCAIQKTLNVEALNSLEEIPQPAFYPNPATQFISFYNPASWQTIVVINMQGKEIMRRNINAGTQKLDISELQPAVYQVLLQGNEGQSVYLLVKE